MRIGVRSPAGLVTATAVLALTFLGACGGGEEPVLTTRAYADALEDAHATLQEDGEKLGEDLERSLEDAFEKLGERPSPLSEDSWSDEDAEHASEFAETLLRANIDAFEGTRGVIEDYGDAISSLRPPAQLAALHNTMTAGIEEIVREFREAAANFKEIDTDIDSDAELEDFWTALESIADSDSGTGEQMEDACRELRARLEAELGASVAICD